MNMNVFKMSMVQNFKSFLVWLVTLPALVALGMAFYPAISESIADLAGLFENPMMKGILGLFAMGPDQLSSLPGFYITYASIYVILMGGIFAALSSINDIAGEMRDKTAEFLLTRPVSRKSILLSKWFAVEVRLLILTVVLCIVTFLCFTIFSSGAPISYYENQPALQGVLNQIEKASEKIKEVWTLDDDFFTGWTMGVISNAVEADPTALDEINLSQEDQTQLLEKIQEDPEALFDDLENDPEKYMAMFGMPASQREAFLKGIQDRKSEFETIKKRYESDASFHKEMIQTAPDYFFKAIKTRVEKETLIRAYPEAEKDINKLLSAYNPQRIVLLHVSIFLFMTAIASLSAALSAGLKQSKNAFSIGIGMVVVLYFISTLLKISPATAQFVWISPFGLIDQNITGGAYSFNWGSASILLLEAGAGLGAALVLFERRDI